MQFITLIIFQMATDHRLNEIAKILTDEHGKVFTDAQGNVWTVHGSAAITSTQNATSIAMLGPLGSDECDEWVDFSLPRTGVGRTCDHDPESCCSYYRARTVGLVDGSVLVSAWSDAFNPGLPEGLAVMWPSTDASVPFGWDRVTELDGRYVKSIPNTVTDPGATGGSFGHLHSTTGHTHGLDHAHTTADTTGTGVPTMMSQNGAAGTHAYPASHQHTRPDTNTATPDSGTSAPGSGVASNDPAHLEVVWISSNGNPLGFPDGSLVFMPDISPAGWDTYANATDRFIKGAPSGGNGGSFFDSELSNHNHVVDAHTHTGSSHTHTSANTGAVAGSLSFFSGPNFATWTETHDHTITTSSSPTAVLQSSSGGTSDDTSPDDPPYRNLRVRQNTSGQVNLPIGAIAAWRRPLADLPVNWALCDGTDGTPDMMGRYPRAATASIEGTGGSDSTHTHTTPTHVHNTSGHSHASSSGPAAGNNPISVIAAVATVAVNHTHTLVDTDSTIPVVEATSSGTLQGATTEPAYEEVALVQLMSEPVPPSSPQTFCLEWSDDYHLMRTTGPNGPMYAQVGGKFEWDVVRPFTAATGVMGSRFVTSATPGGRNLHMVAAVESEAALAELRAVLARPLVLISPSDSSEVWAAPVAESVRIVKVGRIRQVMADFIATGPEPGPQIDDVGV